MSEPDPVMDYLLRDDPDRDDPGYREHMRGTIAYQATTLSFQMHEAVEAGIESLPRWLRPAFRGWQVIYQRWIDPIGRKIPRSGR